MSLKINKMEIDKPSEPDSTTVEKEVAVGRKFAVNDDVLCHIPKGDQHYLGIVIQVNNVLQKCLVKFLDDTETWCNFADMKFLNMTEQEVICLVCKESHNKNGNQLRACSCGRGYHEKCHEPNISSRDQDWKCKICCAIKESGLMETTKLPFVLLNVIDASHNHQVRQNVVEHQQCICGQSGVWYRGMVQCRRCRQWYHSKCVRTLDHKVFSGDRFYILLCSGCNHGKELCLRITPTWSDLVHLVLFNISLRNHNKYHDLDSSIMTFVNHHWPEFNLPPEMAKTSYEMRRMNIEAALMNNEKRFRCGREAKKRTSIWALRVRGAPRAPLIPLPSIMYIDEQYLRRHIQKFMQKSKDMPLQNGHINSSKKEGDVAVKSVPSVTSSDNHTTDSKVGSSTEYHGCGLVKRSVPFPLVEQLGNVDARFRSHAVRRAARLLRRRKPQPDQKVSESEDDENEGEEVVVKKNLKTSNNPKAESTPKEEIRRRPQRNLLEARLNSTESKLYNPQAAAEKQLKKNKEGAMEAPGKKLRKSDGERRYVQRTILDSWRRDSKVTDAGGRLGQGAESGSSGDDSKPHHHTPIKTVITKRQLSEKDIIVDSNGQVRRKKRQRRLVSFAHVPPPAPVPTDDSEYFRLGPSFLNSRPITRETASTLFGPIRRIADGEKYEILAQRVLPNGRVEAIFHFPGPS